MYDSGAPRRRISPALIVVLIVLAGAAGTGAYLVVHQVMAGDGSSPVATGPSTRASNAPAPSVPTSAAASAAGAATTFAAPTGDACPAFTTAAVKAANRPGNLKLLLYVDAALTGTDGAEAWVCQDSDGSLFYQGHNKTGPATNATTDNTILVGPGIRGTVVKAGTGYQATNSADGGGQVVYTVNLEVLSVKLPSGDLQTFQVTRHLPN
jgi:hypothetical protein